MGRGDQWRVWSGFDWNQRGEGKVERFYALGCVKWSESSLLGRRQECALLCLVFDVEVSRVVGDFAIVGDRVDT